jgi:hypothetical protein
MEEEKIAAINPKCPQKPLKGKSNVKSLLKVPTNTVETLS